MRKKQFSLQIVLGLFAAILVCSCATPPKQKRVSARKPKSQVAREIQRELAALQRDLRTRKSFVPSEKNLASKAANSKPASFMGPRLPAAEEASLRLPQIIPHEIVQIDKPQVDQTRVPVLVNPEFASGEIATDESAEEVTVLPSGPLKSLKNFEDKSAPLSKSSESSMVFELPVTYNSRVRRWIVYFQTEGRQSFRRWMERSTRWLPYIHSELEQSKMPMDLMYVALIESGFQPGAVSPAGAVGMWQFIRETGNRYGLRSNWWLDERRDVHKATRAAIRYMSDLHEMFGSWYLVAASYNMGENGVKRLIRRHNSNDFWYLADRGVLPEETKNYVPKIIAAMLMAKAPALYGFRDLQYDQPYVFDYFEAPGGTDLSNLANFLGVSANYLRELNPELLHGLIPPHVRSHRIRIPKGATATVAKYVEIIK